MKSQVRLAGRLFVSDLFLLRLFFLGVLGPGRSDAGHAGIGDGLSKVLGGVAHDEEQNAALSILAAEPVQALVEVGVRHGFDRRFRVREGVFQCGDDFGFVGGGFLEGLAIESSRWRRADQFVQVVVRRANVQEHFRE